jgi:His/Glu/Gln/Arg/opine family amino acid ABC transporter permease subunit
MEYCTLIMSVFDILIKYQSAFANGLATTFQLALIIWFFGLTVGALLGSLGAKWKNFVGIPSRVISFALSGVPILVFLFWLHYPLQTLLGVVIDPFITAALTLSIINVFAVADVIRGVLLDFPSQYVIAGRVCGMTQGQILLHIQLPIVLRQTVPVLLMIQVNMLQATLFASLISVPEIFRVAQQINSQIYKPVEIYTALGLLFLAVCLPLNGLALWLKAKYTRDYSER